MHTGTCTPRVAHARPCALILLYFFIRSLGGLLLGILSLATNSPVIPYHATRARARGKLSLQIFLLHGGGRGVQYKRSNPIAYSGLCSTTRTLGIIQDKKKAPTKGPKFILEGG